MQKAFSWKLCDVLFTHGAGDLQIINFIDTITETSVVNKSDFGPSGYGFVTHGM